MKCSRCQHDNQPQAKFCPECGAPVRESSERSAPSYADIQGSLVEARKQQTATSEILRVISRSRSDVQPVLETILASAISLLQGFSGVVTRVVGPQIQLGAFSSIDEAGDTTVRGSFHNRCSLQGRSPRPCALARPSISSMLGSIPGCPNSFRPAPAPVASAAGWSSRCSATTRRSGRSQ